MNELPRSARPVPIDSRPAPKETDDDLPMRSPVADERPRRNGPQETPGLAMNVVVSLVLLRAKPKLIKWTPDCTWKCPLCDLEISKDVVDRDVHYSMRMEHREADHPKVGSKMFLLQGSNKGFAKATLAKNSAGVSKRLLATGLKSRRSRRPRCNFSQVSSNSREHKSEKRPLHDQRDV